MKRLDRDPRERVSYWRHQVVMLLGEPPERPGRDAMLTTARERLAMWERRAAFHALEGGGALRRVRSVA